MKFLNEYKSFYKEGDIVLIEYWYNDMITPVKILEKDYHLSYPFVFEDNNEIFMIPESKENKTIDLYKCIDFPYKWKHEKTLINNIMAVDATVLFKDNKYFYSEIFLLHKNTKTNKIIKNNKISMFILILNVSYSSLFIRIWYYRTY